jgi:2-polyprenyl-3-methyl-5-hydroxy-6-metoxy-1,4-benzoquinol methylase
METSGNFSYSDGETVESSLLATLRNTTDLSLCSDELEAAITDWPSRYHFSRVRHNLIRHLPINKNDSILEVGCGCGALTSYLAERASHVTALDGSPKRISIAQERCRNLPNIEFVCSNIQDYNPCKKYDIITLIGVLEYSGIYINNSSDPYHYLLSRLRGMLKDEGELIVAIENKVGLKYFSGFPEDHNGIVYYGIKSLYKDANDFRTFGKIELKSILNRAGFTHTRFYYPFPDYKIPRLILTEKGEQSFTSLKNLWQVISGLHSESYYGSRVDSFSEELVWQGLYQNGILGDHANSFLVRCGANACMPEDPGDPLAYYYSDPKRKAQYHAFARIQMIAESGSAIVNRQYVYDITPRQYHTLTPVTEYIDGLSLHLLIAKACERVDYLEFLRLIRLWKHFIVDSYLESGHHLIKARYFDSNPFNLIMANDCLTCIDEEWVIDGEVPIGFLFIHYFLLDPKHISHLLSRLSSSVRVNVSNEIRDLFSLEKLQAVNYVEFISSLYDKVLCRLQQPVACEAVHKTLALLSTGECPPSSVTSKIKSKMFSIFKRGINRLHK